MAARVAGDAVPWSRANLLLPLTGCAKGAVVCTLFSVAAAEARLGGIEG